MTVPMISSIRPDNIDGLIAMELDDATFHKMQANIALDAAIQCLPHTVSIYMEVFKEHAGLARRHHAAAIGWASR